MQKKTKKYSGNFVLRVPPDFHRKLSQMASQSGESLNRFCLKKIKDSLQLHPSLSGVEQKPSFQSTLAEKLKSAGIPLIGIVMFGSTARGEARDSSDIDLLLVVDQSLPLTRKLYQIWDDCISTLQTSSEISAQLSPQFVVLPREPANAGSLWFETAIEGLIWMDTDFKIERFLAQIRMAIVRGEIRREVSHGHPYWIKNLNKVS
jgi:predicted nucleotidyltransferase